MILWLSATTTLGISMRTTRRVNDVRQNMWVALVAVVLAGCVGSSVSSAQFWARFQITGNEVEGFPTVGDMARAADAVVMARVTSVEKGRSFQGDSSDDHVYHVALTLEVAELVNGTAGDQVELEMLAPQVFTDDQFDTAIAGLRKSLPMDQFMVFLRRKDDSASLRYRVVNSY